MSGRRPSAAERDRDRDALAAAILELNRDGLEPLCTDDPRFLDDDRETRAEVLDHCQRCDILTACAAAGRHERFGIWAGQDRTPDQRRDLPEEET